MTVNLMKRARELSRKNNADGNNEIKKAAIILYLEGSGLRGIGRSLSKIFQSKISFQIVSHWINSISNIVANEVAKRKEESSIIKELPVVEMDELYTYIKKNLARTGKQEHGKAIIPEYGLLLIKTQAICLNLK